MASSISTIFFPENLYEFCNRLTFLLQEKEAGDISNKIDEEIVAIADMGITIQLHIYETA